MGILDVFGRKASAPKQANQATGLQRIWTRAPTREKSEMPELYNKNPRLDPVDVIATAAASVPAKLYRSSDLRMNKKQAEPLPEHDLYGVLENPMSKFPEIDGHGLKYLTFVLTELVGEMFWWKIRATEKGPPVEIYPLMPSWITWTPTKDAPWFMAYPFGATAGQAIKIPADDVVWFKQPDPTDPYGRGMGRSYALGQEISGDEKAASYQLNFFANDATPPGIIVAPGATHEQAQAIKDNWIAKVGGWMNARKPAVLNWEGSNFIKLADSSREIDMVASRRYYRDEALQHYQIPPEIFGIVENSNRATIDSAFYLFGKNVLAHRLNFYERAVTRQIVMVDYDKSLVYKHDEHIPEDEQFALDRLTKGMQIGAITRAEWRKGNGLEATPDDDVYVMPLGLVEVPVGEHKTQAPVSAPIAPKPTPGAPSKPTATNENEPVQSEDGKYLIEIIGKTIDPRRVATWKAFDAKARQGETAFVRSVRSFSAKQKARVKKALAGGEPALDHVIAALGMTFGKDADMALKHALAPAWLASMHDGADHARMVLGKAKSIKEGTSGVDPTFEIVNQRFNEWVDTNGLLRAEGINDTTMESLRKKIAGSLSEGIAAGESNVSLATRILAATDDVYDEMDGSRADLIARTESCATVNFGQVEQYREDGVEQKEWLATQDDRTRDDHLDTDGQVVSIDDDFSVGGDSMSAPGLGSLAEENCNCRCTILPVIA